MGGRGSKKQPGGLGGCCSSFFPTPVVQYLVVCPGCPAPGGSLPSQDTERVMVLLVREVRAEDEEQVQLLWYEGFMELPWDITATLGTVPTVL